MKTFKIKSPSGKIHLFTCETVYEAKQRAVANDGYKYSNIDYKQVKTNKTRKK